MYAESLAKGTIAIWADEHLVVLDLRSPNTVANLAHNPVTEINVVDPIGRKGYRFKGIGRVITGGAEFDSVTALFARERGVDAGRVHGAVLVRVARPRR
jgi:hypothetical protein